MTPEELLPRLERVRRSGAGWEARCPAHDDKRASLSVGKGADGRILLTCHAGCSLREITHALSLQIGDLFPPREKSDGERRGRLVATYRYTDERGMLLFEVCRFEPKRFVQRRPDGSGGWVWSLSDTRRVLYNLVAISQADPSQTVFLVEGEKDADNLEAMGLRATTAPGGATKWRKEYATTLRGRYVVIIPDNDEPGRAHGEHVAKSLAGVAASVKVLDLPGLPEKGDVSDWLRAGGTAEELLRLAASAPERRRAAQSPDLRRTDAANADRLVARHGQNLHYCTTWNKWLHWDGQCWALDEKLRVVELAKETARSLAEEPDLADWAEDSLRESRLNAMVNLARPLLAVTHAELDENHDVLNVLNGTIDLRTGELHPHRREDLITKLAPVEYQPDAECLRWRAFLERVMGGNEALVRFLQRAVGYCLTGRTSEQVLFVLHGTGANGKTVFVETVRSLLGDHARQADFTSFLASKSDGPRNDLARLAGARFVIASEAEEGRRLAESTIKALTGGDTIVARYLYAEHFEFTPQFKLFLVSNYKPRISGTDLGIWRRIRLVPFTVTIPEDERDPQLLAKLQAELPGILHWAVKGAVAWYCEGLRVPAEVRAATDAYREEEDILGDFLATKCTLVSGACVSAAALYKAYLSFCEQSGDKPISQKRFGGQLSTQGLERRKSDGTIRWHGIGLLGETTSGRDGSGTIRDDRDHPDLFQQTVHARDPYTQYSVVQGSRARTQGDFPNKGPDRPYGPSMVPDNASGAADQASPQDTEREEPAQGYEEFVL